MFEIITQSQSQDYQSLEILKEAYRKLEREDDLLRTAHRIAQAYVQLGQLSSAIFEYESILQRRPDDPQARSALAEIESAAGGLDAAMSGVAEVETLAPSSGSSAGLARAPGRVLSGPLDDGRQAMSKLFVASKLVSQGDFDHCWPSPDAMPNGHAVEPFILSLAERGTLQIDKSIKVLCEKSRLALLPLDRYDVDYDLARDFPSDICLRWCVLPFDRMSKSVMVATANPFNAQAAQEIEAATSSRVIYYLASPQEIMRGIKKAFR